MRPFTTHGQPPSPGRLLLVSVSALWLALALGACGSSSKTNQSKPSNPAWAFEPSPGVYSYATQGSERVDALLGAQHHYPSTTRVRVKRTACGYSERWTARRERYMESSYCVLPNGSRRLTALTDFHEFFGYPEGRTYRCDGTAIPNLKTVKTSYSWTDRCKARKTSLTLQGEVVGREQLSVAGDPLATVHLKVVATSKGHSAGRNVNDYWLAETNGLLVRRSVKGQATTRTPVGAVRSVETFKVKLKSTRPAT